MYCLQKPSMLHSKRIWRYQRERWREKRSIVNQSRKARARPAETAREAELEARAASQSRAAKTDPQRGRIGTSAGAAHWLVALALAGHPLVPVRDSASLAVAMGHQQDVIIYSRPARPSCSLLCFFTLLLGPQSPLSLLLVYEIPVYARFCIEYTLQRTEVVHHYRSPPPQASTLGKGLPHIAQPY